MRKDISIVELIGALPSPISLFEKVIYGTLWQPVQVFWVDLSPYTDWLFEVLCVFHLLVYLQHAKFTQMKHLEFFCSLSDIQMWNR